MNVRYFTPTNAKVLPEAISRLTNLQTLDICFTDITELAINIGSLQNLQSLNISGTNITELPDSITLIYNLKNLEFRKCSELEVLPCNLGVLTQLRSLDLRETEIRELPKSLSSKLCKLESVNLGNRCHIPKDIKNWVELRCLEYSGLEDARSTRGIEMLRRLEVLDCYYVRKQEDHTGTNISAIKELANLNSLWKLEIGGLQNVRGKIDAERAKLKDKQNIRELGLHWEKELADNNSVMVLDGLQPHSNLRKLEIDRFSGSKFPNWMGTSSCLPNLVELYLSNCCGCEKLPALGMLPRLKVLWMNKMSSVECLGEEFYYQEEEEESKGSAKATPTTTSSFPSLI